MRLRGVHTVRETRKEVYAVLKVAEGGPGQKQKLYELKEAGIKAEAWPCCYVGHSGIRVHGNKKVQVRADRIIFGYPYH